MRRFAAALPLLAVACHQATSPTQASFGWAAQLGDLPFALLSAWTSGDEAVLVGSGGILEWRAGGPWQRAAVPAGTGTLWWVDGTPEELWAVGERATVLVRRAGLWRREDAPLEPRLALYGVFVAGEKTWFVGGAFGASPAGVVYARGETPALLDRPLFKIWGAAADDLWAVGAGGTILHGDGRGFVEVASGTTERLVAVRGRGSRDVYAVGGDAIGRILRWDGSAWAPLATALVPLSGVWTAPGRGVYVAGDRGFVARYGDEEGAANGFLAAAVDFHALAGDDRRILAVGADLSGSGPGSGGALFVLGASTATSLQAPVADGGPADGPPDSADGPPNGADGPGPGERADGPGPGAPDGGEPPGPGRPCDGPCAPALTCTALALSEMSICTESCAGAAACAAYGPGACCTRPTPQALGRVCVPASFAECRS